ncbi:MAG: HAD family hydrolase [Clostridia bacterium]|nr:HAD family hydrolase [Clostridia bacterium]
MITVNKLTEIEPLLQNVAVVIFDLDDTLYPEKEYVRSGYRAIAKQTPEIENMSEKLWHVFENGGAAIDDVLKNEGVFSEEKKQECLNIYRFQVPEISLYEDAKQLLINLKNKGVPLGIITDGRVEGQCAKIKALEIEKYIDYIIITDELGGISFRKPNEKAFVMMQEHFGVPFGEMVYIGDNPRKDFIAPQKLGMKSIHFANKDGIYNK